MRKPCTYHEGYEDGYEDAVKDHNEQGHCDR